MERGDDRWREDRGKGPMEKDRWRRTAGKRTKGGDRTEVKGPMERGQMEKTDGERRDGTGQRLGIKTTPIQHWSLIKPPTQKKRNCLIKQTNNHLVRFGFAKKWRKIEMF